MPHSLEKFYNAFKGLNTRENRLQMDPDSLRKADNIRFNFKDELVKANGFQHKDSGAPSFVQQFEYRFRDINTGEAKSEILAVGTDGNLYRKKNHTLTFLTTGAATSYSVYYDEVSDGFILDMVGLGQVAIGDTTTLDQLKTALNDLTGVSVDIVDDAGNSVVSSQLAYLLDCVIENDFQDNSVFYWEVVPHPNLTCVSVGSVTEANLNILDPSQWTVNGVPFPTTVKAQDPVTYPDVARNYEGISTVNINNVIYISDGGFPMKYDGKTVYRSGLPKQINTNFANGTSALGTETETGITYTVVTAASVSLTALPAGEYKYKARFGFTDYQGSTVYGEAIEIDSPLSPAPIAASNVVRIDTKGIFYGQDFPAYSAKVNGLQGSGIGGAGITLTVDAGHNILPGMVIRQLTTTTAGASTATRATSNTSISFLAKVTAVTATTLTLQETADSDLGSLTYSSNFRDDQIVQGYFVESLWENKLTSGNVRTGAFLEIYRSKVNAPLGPLYKIYSMEVPHVQGQIATIYDNKADSSLIESFTDAEPGHEIPRACKYLSKWQNQLVQSGRPADTSLKDEKYPSVVVTANPTQYSQTGINTLAFYNENLLCDFQSIYWADALAPEGFPQDGLHEFAVDTFANDEIKGIAPNKDAFFAFKERSTGVLTGSLAKNDIVLEIIEDDIGCASHNSIQDVGGSLFWLDARKGFYSCVAGRLPVPVGFNISDYQRINAQGLDYSQAKSANLRGQSLYLCSVGTTTFVFDYANQGNTNRACWYLWTRLNGKSLVADADDQMLIYDGIRTWKMKITNTKYDFTDHKSAIPMDAQTAWITLGQPIIDKNFQHIWINSIQGGFSLGVTQWANYLDYQQSEKTIDFIPESSTKKAVKMDIKANLAKLSAISFGFKNAEKNKFVRIQGWEIEYAPDYDRGEGRR